MLCKSNGNGLIFTVIAMIMPYAVINRHDILSSDQKHYTVWEQPIAMYHIHCNLSFLGCRCSLQFKNNRLNGATQHKLHNIF